MSGSALSATTGEAHAAVEMVARRVGILNSQESLNLGNMREMKSRIAHLRGMLEAAPWSGKTTNERCEHALSSVLAAERAATRASDAAQGGGGAAGAGGADAKDKRGGQETVRDRAQALPGQRTRRDQQARIPRADDRHQEARGSARPYH